MIEIFRAGIHNTNHAGPDFFDARIQISDQKWAGNVEVHLRSSDWYVHQHHKDASYDNVILHVVWEDDVEVYRKDNSAIPTLELKQFVATDLLKRYKYFLNYKKKWIPCEKLIHEVPEAIQLNWLEKLYIERLERKSNQIAAILKQSSNNWDFALYQLLFRSFGSKVNGEAFQALAAQLDFATFRKVSNNSNILHLEALLLGQAGLLSSNGLTNDAYLSELKMIYSFLARKYTLNQKAVPFPFQFFRLRPSNFPTIRLVQLANLYHEKKQLFQQLMVCQSINEFYASLQVSASSYWDTHYTFSKISKFSKKRISKPFIDLLVINTVIPIKFLYHKSQHSHSNIGEEIIELMTTLAAEKNSIIQAFSDLGVPAVHAMHSQALLQLKSNYCDSKSCLDCAIGNQLLKNNT